MCRKVSLSLIPLTTHVTVSRTHSYTVAGLVPACIIAALHPCTLRAAITDRTSQGLLKSRPYGTNTSPSGLIVLFTMMDTQCTPVTGNRFGLSYTSFALFLPVSGPPSFA